MEDLNHNKIIWYAFLEMKCYETLYLVLKPRTFLLVEQICGNITLPTEL